MFYAKSVEEAVEYYQRTKPILHPNGISSCFQATVKVIDMKPTTPIEADYIANENSFEFCPAVLVPVNGDRWMYGVRLEYPDDVPSIPFD